jgi:CheY-like chemotaxis protein
MAFSRQQVIDPEDLDLNEAIQSSQKMLSRLIGEHIEFDFIAGDDLHLVLADRGQMNQLLMNLCTNARDAMSDGGKITIETKNVMIHPADLADCGLTRSGPYVLLSITDTGCGMDAKTCDRIFDPFFTTKEMGRGTGLGLSTVYGIVQQNEGHITVHSEPSKGTTFKVYFPASQPLPATIVNSMRQSVEPDKQGVETILMVEDDEAVLNLATRIVSNAGYTVFRAKDGEEAVRIFEKHADEIDCVMMDVVMPRMGGKEAMEKILKKRPSMRHLFVSGYSPDAGHTHFVKEQGAFLLGKPYEARDLLKKIREVLDEGIEEVRRKKD